MSDHGPLMLSPLNCDRFWETGDRPLDVTHSDSRLPKAHSIKQASITRLPVKFAGAATGMSLVIGSSTSTATRRLLKPSVMTGG
ncbi:MAG: hypothetical protein ACFBSF_10305 [Leptolyngbyaceae cyanobacterium]